MVIAPSARGGTIENYENLAFTMNHSDGNVHDDMLEDDDDDDDGDGDDDDDDGGDDDGDGDDDDGDVNDDNFPFSDLSAGGGESLAGPAGSVS